MTTSSSNNETTFRVKAGGKKGEAISAELVRQMTERDWQPRTAIAETANCTVARVGEAVRYLAATPSEAGHKAAVWHVETADGQKAAKKAAKSKAEQAARDAKAHAVVTSLTIEQAEAAHAVAGDTLSDAGAYRMAAELIAEGASVPQDVLEQANAYAKKAKRRRLAVVA